MESVIVHHLRVPKEQGRQSPFRDEGSIGIHFCVFPAQKLFRHFKSLSLRHPSRLSSVLN